MFITKLSNKDGKTTVRYLHEFEELEISTENAPRPELVHALACLKAVAAEVLKHPNSDSEAQHKRLYRDIYYSPFEFTRTKKEHEGERIKISCNVHCGIHGIGKLVTPAILVKALDDDLQALVANAVEEAERFAKGERAQLEFEAVAGKEAA